MSWRGLLVWGELRNAQNYASCSVVSQANDMFQMVCYKLGHRPGFRLDKGNSPAPDCSTSGTHPHGKLRLKSKPHLGGAGLHFRSVIFSYVTFSVYPIKRAFVLIRSPSNHCPGSLSDTFHSLFLSFTASSKYVRLHRYLQDTDPLNSSGSGKG